MANRQRAWIAVLAIGILLPVLAALGWTVWSTFSPPPSLRGLRLGLTPAQARSAWSTGSPGSFRTQTQGEDLALIWTPRSPGDLIEARLEFHLGQLVAVRLLMDGSAPEARGPRVEITRTSVLAREETPHGVRVTWIARACPTHAAEVARLMGGA